MRRMLPSLCCLLLSAPALAAPEGREAPRPAPVKVNVRPQRDLTPPPPAAPAPAAPADAAPSTAGDPPPLREERDPREQRRFDHRRADAVRARHRGRQLLHLGREVGDPVLLVTAAQLFEQSPPPRPLSVVPPPAPWQPAAAPGAAPQPGPLPGAPGAGAPQEAGPLPPQLRDVPTRTLLLAEARALARARRGPLLEPTLALIDRAERMEVISRGATDGPQQSCDALSPGVKLTYGIRYEGKEQAVVAIAGDGPGYLMVSVLDEAGQHIATGPDRALVSWYPQRRAVYRVSIENHTHERISFCLETN